ncbi:NUDIX hydrolase [Ilumatobacter sp.]|uniref:NUDIX hydrolase n=1 Tax=Ilumatobacter sp. TaxID=1967498 RepID=UPI003B51E07D
MDEAVTIERVRRDVALRSPLDEREAESVRRFLEALEHLDEPMSQLADPTHVTASGIVVGPRGVLLLRHRRLGIWLQPGGHVDAGETPWSAALRECREETGLELAYADALDADGVPPLRHVDVHAGGRGHVHLDLRYLVVAGHDDPDPPDGESQEVGWFDWATAVAMADPGLVAALEHLRPTDAAP